MDCPDYMAQRAAEVNAAAPRLLRGLGARPGLLKAMLYSFSAGGKRLRPALMGAAYEAYGGNPRDITPAACALEMVHTYSLIHDDLPCMDDDDLRRGKPTCHKAFGEAAAVLAGDALLTDAFTVLLGSRYPARVKPAAVSAAALVLSKRAGAAGMVSGQAADLEAEVFMKSRGFSGAARRRKGLALLGYIHRHKTADLIAASVLMGGTLAGAPSAALKALEAFGLDLGLCFQVADDILDVTADRKKLGKAGSDARNGKLTYVTLLGLQGARRHGARLFARALSRLERVGAAARGRARLAALAEFVYRRDN